MAGSRKPPDDAPTFRRANAAVVGKNADKRRTTVYFDLAVAQELARFCASQDLNMSEVVTAAVREFLRSKKR